MDKPLRPAVPAQPSEPQIEVSADVTASGPVAASAGIRAASVSNPEVSAGTPDTEVGAGATDVIQIGPQPRLPSLLMRWLGVAVRATARWASQPIGRLVLPGAVIALLIGATGAAGAYFVPATARPSPPPAADGTGSGAPTTATPDPGGVPTDFPPVTTGPDSSGREAAKLAAWAAPLAARLQIPQTALEAYGYAQWVLSQIQPDCKLSWTTLAAIGKVESDHGRAGGATLTPDGRAFPPIVGPALDGQGGRKEIRDSDTGALDNDAQYDRAIGPMQFIPTTWRSWGTDADNNAAKDPHDIDDASLSAARYLCTNNRDLSTPTGWSQAVLSYNHVQSYADAVFAQANSYGQQSRNTP